jgi:hypothetical protein
MIDVQPIAFDAAVLTQSVGAGIADAVMVTAMIGFLIWNVVLSLQTPK